MQSRIISPQSLYWVIVLSRMVGEDPSVNMSVGDCLDC